MFAANAEDKRTQTSKEVFICSTHASHVPQKMERLERAGRAQVSATNQQAGLGTVVG
jgi:hypothetical protein